MRLFISVFVLLLQVASVVWAEDARIAVLDFESIGLNADAGAAASELLCTELALIPGMRLVERSALRRLVEERRLQATDFADAKAAAELAKLAGARLVVVGSAIRTGAVLTLTARMIDVGTGEVVRGAKANGRSEGDIPRMCQDLAAALAQTEAKGKPITGSGTAAGMDDGAEVAAIADALRKCTERLRGEGRQMPMLRKSAKGEALVGDALTISSETRVKDFVAESDIIRVALQTPTGVKHAVVVDFQLKKEEGAQLSAKELRGYLTQLGFEVSPARRLPDGCTQVSLTYWLK